MALIWNTCSLASHALSNATRSISNRTVVAFFKLTMIIIHNYDYFQFASQQLTLCYTNRKMEIPANSQTTENCCHNCLEGSRMKYCRIVADQGQLVRSFVLRLLDNLCICNMGRNKNNLSSYHS